MDKLRSKNAMSSVIIADLVPPEGEDLWTSWIQMPNVVGFFLHRLVDLLHELGKSR